MTEICLNADADWDAAARRFAGCGRAQVRDVFPEALAERIHRCLDQETPWFTVYHDGSDDCVISPQQLRAMTDARRRRMISSIHGRARHGFQYLYNSYPYLGGQERRYDKDLFLHRIADYLNERIVLERIERLAGLSGLTTAEMQATLYRADHFLTMHTDEGPNGAARRVAFVFNFTKDWRADWGGYVQFYDDDDNVIEAFAPRFNSLNLFAVPTRHSVSYVTPFAEGRRYAITGWFRDD